VLSSERLITVGQVPADMAIGEAREFSAEFRTLNGVYTQNLFEKRRSNGYFGASRVTRAGEVLHLHPDDPGAWTEEGKPTWTKVPGVEGR